MEATGTSTTIGPFVQGLVGAVALGSMSSAVGGGAQSAATLAVGFGILAAVLGLAPWLGWWAGFLYSGIGVIAFVSAAVSFAQADGCTGLPPAALRIAALALLLIVAGLAMFASVVSLGRGLSTSAGLGLFGAVETLIAVSMFIADGSSAADGIAIAVLLLLAPVLGWAAVRATDAALGVAGVAVGMQAIYASALGANCSVANFSGAVLIVVFCVVYAVTKSVAGIFTRGR